MYAATSNVILDLLYSGSYKFEVSGWKGRYTKEMNDPIRAKVRSIVEKFLDKNQSSEISDTTKLITLGYIDSFSIVELISILEAEFAFQFDPTTLKIETFESIKSISEAVELATQTKFLKHG